MVVPFKSPEDRKAYAAAYNKTYYQRNAETLKQATRDRYDSTANAIYQLARNYGLSRDEARARWESKPSECEVCGTPETDDQHGRLCYEHNHDTGAFRAWTCHTCNRILGLAHDDPARLRALADYLDAHDARNQRLDDEFEEVKL